MKRFRRKIFSFITSPQGLLTTAALGVSSANLATNLTRHVNDKRYQERQLKAMGDLSGNLGKFNQTLEETRRQQQRLAEILNESNNLQRTRKSEPEPKKKTHWIFKFRKKKE